MKVYARSPCIEEFELEKTWWGGASREGREETEHAWRVPIDRIEASNYNLDIKNPHKTDDGPGDADTLLAQLQTLQGDIDAIRDRLKEELDAAIKSVRAAPPTRPLPSGERDGVRGEPSSEPDGLRGKTSAKKQGTREEAQ